MSSRIVYSAIFQQKEVVVSYSETTGNFKEISQQIVEHLPKDIEKISYIYDKEFHFYFLTVLVILSM
jgi:hypothetical protein